VALSSKTLRTNGAIVFVASPHNKNSTQCVKLISSLFLKVFQGFDFQDFAFVFKM
jgi:hypothetical protein